MGKLGAQGAGANVCWHLQWDGLAQNGYWYSTVRGRRLS